jgi:hypothetical protein
MTDNSAHFSIPDRPLAETEVADSMNRARAVILKSGEALARAAEAISRFEAFSEKYNIHLVDGREALAGEGAFPARKLVFETLFFELDHLDTRVREMAGEVDSAKARPSIGARAVGNRYRI